MKGKGSGWKGESRRHSLARKGVKTANGKTKYTDPAGFLIKPDMVKNMEMAMKLYNPDYPKFVYDKGAMDGEPFGWIDFGWEDEDRGIGLGSYVIVMDHDHYEIVSEDGKVMARTDDLQFAENLVKELSIKKWWLDMLDSPYGKLMDYVKDGDLTDKGMIEYDRFATTIRASGCMKAKGELQFKTPINNYSAFMDNLSEESIDVGSDADYSDPNNYATVIVRIPDNLKNMGWYDKSVYDDIRNKVLDIAKKHNAKLKYEGE